jgi:hypothetical protein
MKILIRALEIVLLVVGIWLICAAEMDRRMVPACVKFSTGALLVAIWHFSAFTKPSPENGPERPSGRDLFTK